MEHSEFHLEENEKIVDVEVCYAKMINMLTFWTNKKDDNSEQRCYGPYGDDFGSRECHWEVPEGSCGFLAGVAGAVVNTQEATVITRLQFAWRSYIYRVGNDLYDDYDNDGFDLDVDCDHLFLGH